MKKIVLFMVLIASLGLQAQTTHTVINTNDSGLGSLRAAADSAVAGDTIRLSPSLIASGSDSIVLTTGEIDFDSNGVVIKGVYTSTDTLFISGNNNSRIFSFEGAGRIILDSLVLINGNAIGNSGSRNGGAIYSSNCTDTLFVTNSIISRNTAFYSGGGLYFRAIYSSISIDNSIIFGNIASNGNGGGVYSESLNLVSNPYTFVSIINSKILGNTASASGGGVYSSAGSSLYLIVLNSEISQNSAYGGGGVFTNIFTAYSTVKILGSTIFGNSAISGGGIHSHAHILSTGNCNIDVVNSTISGNTAINSAGGIGVWAYSDSINIEHSTISGNIASSGDGGGIHSKATLSAIINVEHSTISGNTVYGHGGGIYSTYASTNSPPSHTSKVIIKNSTIFENIAVTYGGAIYSQGMGLSSSSVIITSSIIAENVNNVLSQIYSNSVPTIISNGYNIFSDAPTGTIGSDSINITTAQLNLLPLAFNGRTTQTMRPGPGSIAVDNGNPNDNSDAQNAPIVGTRDVGAAEECFALPSSISITACNSYTVPSGNNTYTQSGIYKDTLTTNCGADSVITIDISMVSQYTSFDTIVACDSYTWIDGITYTSNNNTAVDTLLSSEGCDSIVTLDLTILQSSSGIEMITACDSYIWNGITYASSNNTALDTLVNASGCDSIITLDLTMLNSTTSIITTTACDSYTSPSGNVWTSSGAYLDTIPNSVNCDSMITINLTINHSSHLVDTIVACDYYTWIDGITYTTSNDTATQLFTKSNGCDSIIMLNLIINTTQYFTDTIIACSSYTWINGVSYTSNNNTAMDTLLSSSGCDSIVTLNLTILQASSGIEVVTACDHYTWNGVTYTSSNNTALDTLVNAVGCDSIVTLDLTILNSTSSIETITECDSYTSPSGNVWTNSGTYLDTIPNSVNCDSVVTIHLTINTTQYTTDVISACSSYTWIDGVTYTSNNNMAVDTLVSSSGCDSIVTLDLTILQSSSGVEAVTVYDSYTWNGITYTTNNSTALDTLVNAVGCDSIVTLNLTIYNTQYITDVVSACDSYTWIDGFTYTTNNNTAVDTLISSSGCDSIVSLDLTILNSTSLTDVITSCSPIVWIDGNTYTQTTSGPIHTFPNSQGCDSVVTLDFTLMNVDTSVIRNYLTLTAQATNATYQWIDCLDGPMAGETNASFTATVNGDYQVEVTQNGCVDTSACFAVTNVNIQEAELIGVSLYPNPTSDVLHIDKGSNQSLEIKITNSAGAMVFQSTSKNQITSVDMSKMATGMYVVTLKNELGIKVEKVVKR